MRESRAIRKEVRGKNTTTAAAVLDDAVRQQVRPSSVHVQLLREGDGGGRRKRSKGGGGSGGAATVSRIRLSTRGRGRGHCTGEGWPPQRTHARPARTRGGCKTFLRGQRPRPPRLPRGCHVLRYPLRGWVCMQCAAGCSCDDALSLLSLKWRPASLPPFLSLSPAPPAAPPPPTTTRIA